MLTHIHLHARTQQKYQDAGRSQSAGENVNMGRLQLEGLLVSLRNATNSLIWKHSLTEWSDYYADTNYVDESMAQKEELVTRFLREINAGTPKTAADFGANTGRFSRLALAQGYFVLAHDIDEVAVDKNYREAITNSEDSILPLVQNLSNPSPAIGWKNEERMSFIERHNVAVGMALALIHHICISNNVPLESVAEFFSNLCRFLIIEFIPKSDSQVKRLLATRQDVFYEYDEKGFERAFEKYFTIVEFQKLRASERTLYLMKKRTGNT
jgi:ribosomal protein L11 methylase PrmA